MKTIFYVGGFRFPDGDAAAARVANNGRILRALGFDVFYLGWEHTPEQDGEIRKWGPFQYASTGELRPRKGVAEAAVINATRGRNTRRLLERFVDANTAGVICYNGSHIYAQRIRSLCERRRIPFMLDCSEWYDPAQLPGGVASPLFWDNELKMRVFNKRVGHIIAISRYLAEYYSSAGCNVARIPPLVDTRDARWPARREDALPSAPLSLIYAGIPGRKDYIEPILEGIALARARGIRVQFTMLGPTRESILAVLRDRAVLDRLGDCVSFVPRASQHEVGMYLGRADFSILFRPPKRYAKAGFSTKFVESIASGLPIICNEVVNSEGFLQDGKHGVVATDTGAATIADNLARAMALRNEAWPQMSDACRELARQKFDYREYTDTMRAFLRAANVMGAS